MTRDRLRPGQSLPNLLVALLAACVAALVAVLANSALAAPTFPPLSGRVVDEAGLLSPAKEQQLTQKLAALEAETGDQLVIVTLKSLQDYEIEDYGYQLGRRWGIGQAENDSGVLLIVAPNERKVRIEVGYGLEPILTDAYSALIIQNEILPAFQRGGFEEGITRGTDAIIAQLRADPAEAQARAAAAKPAEAEFPVGAAIVVGLIFLFLFISLIGAAARGGRQRRSGLGPILVWTAAEALSSRGRGRGWGGGGHGGFGGGGFGGGGGGFGGGGASGGW